MDNLDLDTIHALVGIPTNDVARAVNDKIRECQATLTKAQFNRLPVPSVAYDLKGTTAGQAFGSTLIRLNLDLLNDPRYREEMINQTLPHEYAHCVVSLLWPKAKAHGYEWQLVCQVLGIEPRRCHNYDAKPARVKARYKYDCRCEDGCSVGPTVHRKVQDGNIYYHCLKCKVVLFTLNYKKVR